jgi:hypothetical protein
MLDQIGNWLGEITGWNPAQRASQDAAATAQANQVNQLIAMYKYNQMNKMLGGALKGTPEERAQRQYQEAFEASKQAGADQAQQAGRQAIMSGRTAGLNPGQAAIMAGQQTGQNYLAGQQQALQQYRQAQDAAMSAQLQGAGIVGGVSVPGLQQLQNTDSSGAIKGTMEGIGSLVSAINQPPKSYRKGTASVPYDMDAKIHKGEIIIPPEASEKIRKKAGTMDIKKLSRMLEDSLSIYKDGGR